ncbi:RHS repeat domain-containing protein [Herbiconiux daphne]|uniref:RHS repeat-associated core domain-containing protein n=1 Tax=Herbiconiux daphne TaxID=2970914 RepID=A0ABT2H1T6_9MICO|nr:RHS repeat-associated core domain-containing protein [Herbiconiux daphne]MCS5733871.1 hypothetical protein [Herbiconiux daphne]
MTAEVLSAQAISAAGLPAPLAVQLVRADGHASDALIAVRIPAQATAGLFGADYASRIRWVQVPTGTEPSKLVESALPVASTIDPTDGSTVLTPKVGAKPMTLMPLTGAESSSGSGAFSASSLKPSSTWDVSAQTGDFSWSLPMRVPPAAAGPTPSVSLQYDSQSIDGETGATNNQPTAVGEGWDVTGGGYIERSYVSCAIDNGASGPTTTSGDLCWKTDNATISLAGHSGQLIRDAGSGTWKLQNDDGSRVEHLIGISQGCADNGTYNTECWRLTTTDGTQYYFGLNKLPGWTTAKTTTNSTWTVPVFGNDPGEPCNTGTFATSSCMQGWRWNLDYVVDTHNNAEALYYSSETNKYARNGSTAVSYTRGGQLEHIDYGLRGDQVYATNAASGKVIFGYDAYGRCNDTSHANCTFEALSSAAVAPAHPTAYPDIPFDQLCTGATCPTLVSPTFWTTGMLNTVTTKTLSGGAYGTVDVWALSHSFPAPGDTTNPALWLTQVVHTGYSGGSSIAEPPTKFNGITMQNRVWGQDGLVPLDKWRISSITLSTGATISVNYSAPTAACSDTNAPNIIANANTNTALCFPQWWSPQVTPPIAAQKDLFHKYVVTSVIFNPVTGGGNDAIQETDYVYTGTPAWRYDKSPLTPDDKRTWSVFAGFSAVEVRVGDHNVPSKQQTTAYTFFQGMDGDQASTAGGTKSAAVGGVTDSLWFAGRTREVKTLNGVGGAVLSATVTTPWASSATASDGTYTAHMLGDAEVVKIEPVSTGGNRTIRTTRTFDGTTGLPLTESVNRSDAGSMCTRTTYTPSNTTAWIIGLPSEIGKAGVDCASYDAGPYPAAAISRTRLQYDGADWGVAAARGDVTKITTVDSYTGTTADSAHWIDASSAGYDAMGRVTTATDILGHTTKTAYTPAAGAAAGGGALVGSTVTNTAGWTTTTTFNPAWGAETSATDQNGKVTTATYDALGRRTGVWLPDRPVATNSTPSIGYAYTVSQTKPLAVATTTLVDSGTKIDYTLYDGLGQQIQTQGLGEGGGSVITDTGYDSAGHVWMTNNPYWTTAVTPSATQFVPLSEGNIPSKVTTTFDGAGRPATSILSSYTVEQQRTTYSYQGADRTDTTPPAGGTPTSTFTDSLGQQTKLIQYLGTSPAATGKETTTYAYDVQGHMSSMIDPAGNQWSWSSDVLGHQISATDPDTGTSTTTYDNAGNILTTKDARGIVLAYTYDALNRKTGQYKDSTGTGGTKLASWTYDTLAKGQLTSTSSYVNGAAYTRATTGYDAAYRPTGASVSIPSSAPAFGGQTFTTTHAYNQDGSLLYSMLPAAGGLPAETMRFAYTGAGRLNSVRGSVQMLSETVYTGIGQVSQYNRVGATSDFSSYGHELATGAFGSIKETTVTGSTFTIVADRQYKHDAAGNVTSVSTTASGIATDTQCYSYDYLRDLTAAWTPASNNCAATPTSTTIGGPSPYWTTYAVDPATGNRTSIVKKAVTGTGTSVTDTYSYPSATSSRPHAVQSVSHSGPGTSDGYGYDASGNMTSRPGQSLTYDATGKLATVTVGTATQSNIYDSSGTLLMQTDSKTGTTLFLDGTDLHIGPGTAGVSAVRTYTADGVPFAERTTTPGVAGSMLRWITTDIDRSSDLQVVVSTGAITRRYTDPYGNPRGATPTWSSNHTFLNAPKSTLSGLVQLGARAYDSAIGKFLSVDPVLSPFNPQQNNGYAYASNTPITLTDPSGLCPLGAGNGCDRGAGKNHGSVSTGTPITPSTGDGPTIGNKAGATNGPWKSRAEDSQSKCFALLCGVTTPKVAPKALPKLGQCQSQVTDGNNCETSRDVRIDVSKLLTEDLVPEWLMEWWNTEGTAPNPKYWSGIVNVAYGSSKVVKSAEALAASGAADETGIGIPLGFVAGTIASYNLVTGGARVLRGSMQIAEANDHPMVTETHGEYVMDILNGVVPQIDTAINFIGGLL